ncbi:hypothetical protein D4764_02G0011010 [Takifugu flavidus]|uniref:Uncharacterized protein n=1 Tax=Takifugu flavidus TaxID=433684 RepID=A0A5C6NPD8_9TELE|nr:hypothetical protein D4764_02G0011010 [Takifugu flavidus]
MAGGVPGEEDLPRVWNKAAQEGVADALQDNTSAGAFHPPLAAVCAWNVRVAVTNPRSPTLVSRVALINNIWTNMAVHT